MKEILLNDLKTAMRNKEELKKDTITMLRAAILQTEKDTQKELTKEEIQIIVSKEVKKRKESIPEFEKADRLDIVSSINKEIEVLSRYLPKQFSEIEIRDLVSEAINILNVGSIKDMGKVMQELKPKINGRADGKLVSDIVKEMLI